MDVSPVELFEMEASALHSVPWPKKRRDPVRLAPLEIAKLLEGEPDHVFHTHAREYLLRLV